MYGLMLYDIDGNGQSDVAFGNKASIVETRINNRIQPIHFGVNYHEEPLHFDIVFGTDEPLDRYDLEKISLWLTGYQDYQWLTIDQPDMQNKAFRCLITEMTPISVGWLNYAFKATVTCDCPYAYSNLISKSFPINGETEIRIFNHSTTREYWKPEFIYETHAGGTLEIINKSDNNRKSAIEGIMADATVTINSNNGIIIDSQGTNLYSGFNLRFPRLVQGENVLKVTGSGTLTIKGRYHYNTAG